MKHPLNQTLLLLGLVSALALGCKKEASIPSVTTDEATLITHISAKSKCTVTNNGGADIIRLGLCWDTNPGPTVSDSVIYDESNTMIFFGTLSGLRASTTYYIRAFAKNSSGTGYGKTVTFTTLPAVLPEVKSVAPTGVTQTSAALGGNVTSDGGAPITARGLCWGTSENPTIADGKTDDGAGMGIFTRTFTGLTRSTTYYARAYATNATGTSYSNNMVVRTMHSTVTDIDGNVYQTVLIGTQEWMAENLKVTHYRNGDPIPNITEGIPWCNATQGAWCSYENKTENKNIYGLLYNHYTATDSRGLSPSGWHIPSDTEWTILINYLGGADVAGYKLSRAVVDSNADNSSGFTGLGGGYRWGFESREGRFTDLVNNYWGMTSTNVRIIYTYSNYIQIYGFSESFGVSYRCLKDN